MSKKSIVQQTPIIIADDDLPIIWVDEFDYEAVRNFTKRLIKLESDPETTDIFIYINSYGGAISAAVAMVEGILRCTKPVHTVGIGIAASCGAVLLANGTSTRWIGPNSTMYIHHAQNGIEGDFPSLEQDVKNIKQIDEKVIELLTHRANITPKELKAKLQNEQKEWQLSATTARKYGFVDRIGIPSFKKYMVTEYE